MYSYGVQVVLVTKTFTLPSCGKKKKKFNLNGIFTWLLAMSLYTEITHHSANLVCVAYTHPKRQLFNNLIELTEGIEALHRDGHFSPF